MKKTFFQPSIKRFCLESTITCLKYLYLYPDVVSRCFWSFSLLLLANFSCWLAFLLYSRYMQMPTRITIENQFEPISELPFPSITLCSANQITVSASVHLNRTLVDGNHSEPLLVLLPQLLGYSEIVELNEEYLQILDELTEINRYSIPEILALLPQTCDRFFKLCFFRGKPRNCKSLFKPVLTQHGTCCIFNNIYFFKNNRRNEANFNYNSEKAQKTGLSEALTVVVDYEPEDVLDKTLLFAGSTRVLINDHHEFPADDELSVIEPGSQSYHLIYATHTYCSPDVKDLNVESRRCNFMHENHLRHFKYYHNSDCDLMCLVQAIEKFCFCQPHYLPFMRLSQACNVSNIACIQYVKLNVFSHWAEEENECECPRDCEARQYKVDTSIGNLDALDYMTTNPYSGIQVNSSTSIMHFFFPTSVYVKQKQETIMSVITFFSNLGGVFGLCLGFSTISVLEILFYFYTFVRNKIHDHIIRVYLKRFKRQANFHTYYD